MDQKFNAVFGTICALLCALCMSKEASSQTLPDGKGKAEFVHNCTACHRADMVTRLKKTPDEWRKTVDEMAARGTDGSKEDLDNVVLYLVTNFGADTSVPATPTPSTTPQPNPNSVRLTKSDEKTLVFQILSQIDHDARVMDASRKVVRYSQTGTLLAR